MKSEFRADTANVIDAAKLAEGRVNALEQLIIAIEEAWTKKLERAEADLAEARNGLPTRWVSALQEEIATLRASLDLTTAALVEVERERDIHKNAVLVMGKQVSELATEIYRLRTALAEVERQRDIHSLAAARDVIARIERESIDDVSRADARAFLERTATPQPGSPE